MPMESCPRCKGNKNMTVAVSRRTETGPDGKPKQIETRSFNCECCNSFVRSEDREMPKGK